MPWSMMKTGGVPSAPGGGSKPTPCLGQPMVLCNLSLVFSLCKLRLHSCCNGPHRFFQSHPVGEANPPHALVSPWSTQVFFLQGKSVNCANVESCFELE